MAKKVNRFKKTFTAVALAGLVTSAFLPAYASTMDAKGNGKEAIQQVLSGKKPHPKSFNLSIMHTNDTHAHLDNAAKRITAIKEVREAKPQSLLIDAGDVFSGTLYFNEFKGQADLEFMNMAKYDVMTFGNHEFDLGSSPEGHEALAKFIKGAKFPFVSSNIDFSKDPNLKSLTSTKNNLNPPNGKIYNSIIKTVNGEKVGIIGLTTEETESISSPENVVFKDYIQSAQSAVAGLEKQGINKIIAVSHLGYDDNAEFDNDLELAKHVDGIDVIVGGHSHTKLEKAVEVSKDENGKVKDPTIIVQAYQYGDFLGTLDVQFDGEGKVIAKSSKLINVSEKADDPEAAEKLKKYADQIKELKNTETGAIATEAFPNPRLSDTVGVSVRSTETALGNLIADGMLAKAQEKDPKTVIAMQNGGGIRAAIDQGPITLGDILTVLPFGNTLATMELSGTQIKEALEHSVSLAPKESGGFLHVSGMKFTYNSKKPAGERVTSMEVFINGKYESIDLTKKYVVATNAFTAKGGDGFKVFEKVYAAGLVTDWGYSDWETFRDYVVKAKEVTPTIEGRIKDIANDIPVVTEENFSGTPEKPAVYNNDLTLEVDSVSKLEHAVVNGSLTIKGNVDSLSFHNLKVTGDLILSGFSGHVNINGVEVEGETIF